ncbi:MAG: phosphate signaling complex protein PhoU [Kiritimatiellia bacterium]
MRDRFGYEMEALKRLVLELAADAENAMVRAIHAVTAGDSAEAQSVVSNDSAIDEMEVEIEEECLKLMALYQPVAGDLRTLITILKVNGELERIADLATNIATRAIDMADFDVLPEEKMDFAPMVERVHQMLRDALDAFVYHEATVARRTLLADDAVDALNAANYATAKERLLKHPAHAGYVLDCLTVSHALERIADIATNICEDVIYLEEGQIVRHQKRM